jgi:hypothetical protein
MKSKTKLPKLIENNVVGYTVKPASQFQAHPLNWRKHPEKQRAAMRGSLNEYGWIAAVIENVRTGHVIDGHERIYEALALGDETPVPCLQVDIPEDKEATALLVFDTITGMAETDKANMDALMRDAATGEAALQELLSELAEKNGLYFGEQPEPKEDPGAQIDKAEELREKWQTSTGQLWEIGRHRLLCGDSTKAEDVARITDGVAIETVVFDPPYDGEEQLLNWRYECKDALVFTDHRHLLDCVNDWGRYRCLFVWDGQTSWYVQGWPLARCKVALWFGESVYREDGAFYGEPGKAHKATNTRGSYDYKPDPRGKHLATVFDSPLTKEFDGHPHAKPVDWVRMLIGNCTTGGVLDPFVGSGTTLVACEQLGRPCRGIEQNPATVAVVLERLSDMGLASELCGD